MSRALICLLLVSVWCSCEVRESERAKLRVHMDSVKRELQASRRDLETLIKIGDLLDSIDRSRYDLLVDWRVEKTPFNKYKYRMRAINSYVIETELRILYLEKMLSGIRNSSPKAGELIIQLNQKLAQRSHEVRRLKAQLSQYAYENKELYQRASQQYAEFDRNEVRLQEQAKNLQALNIKVTEAQEVYEVMQAEAYYGQARAQEEIANRTRFAGGKKREALEQALALYYRALQLGSEEAREKIEELEKRME